MVNFLKSYWKTLLFFAAMGLIGGFFTGLYLLDTYPPAIQQQILDQGLTDVLLGIVTAVQYAGYGLVLGAAGISLGKKVGLWNDLRTVTKMPLLISAGVSVFGGLVLILSDFLFFGKFSQAIMDSYAVKPTPAYILGAVLLGGVVEEVMLRLFLMSLLALLLWKLFQKDRRQPSASVFIAANVVSALLFAAGHLPVTLLILGDSPLILFRCFLLNGSLGLLFGYLYRKYGLRYAMLAHGGCHIISKLIWILFI